MITQARKAAASITAEKAAPSRSSSPLEWPQSAWAFGIAIALLYAPTIAEAAGEWFTDDNYAHGVFIFPVALFLLWLRKEEIQKAERKPEAWGLPLLMLGVALESVSYILQIRHVGMWSLIPTLAGGILMLHGKALWKIAQFPVFFLLLAAPIPGEMLNAITLRVQNASTSGVFVLMSALGYPLIRHGNLIQLPGLTLEVADACSGFHKMLSLVAFSLLYGYLYDIRPWKRWLLLAASLPLALLVNILRIAGLIAIGAVGGLHAVHLAHNGAEYAVIIVAFGLFALLGRSLGCRTIRFLPPSAT